jgi:hypothetical protein
MVDNGDTADEFQEFNELQMKVLAAVVDVFQVCHLAEDELSL